ncbi:hypothetical protein ACQP2Y_12980 [Actinoplanes sp. CA-051413]|uniref:hypothetical protein n=1 Tax=Actinoplanes sp. CA-051413 TaxID=3239899 RepID=UPI003D96BCED
MPSKPTQSEHMKQTYRIRVSDRLGPALCGAFAGMRAEVVPRQTVIEGWLSREEFHALLRRVEQVGIQLVAIERATEDRPCPDR